MIPKYCICYRSIARHSVNFAGQSPSPLLCLVSRCMWSEIHHSSDIQFKLLLWLERFKTLRLEGSVFGKPVH
jgi:hypothetical protein